MDFKTGSTGVDKLLSAIYGEETNLSSLLIRLGFEPVQVEALPDQAREVIHGQLLEVIHKRLTSDAGLDTYYQILNARFGLEGQLPDSLESIAQKRNENLEYVRRLLEEILERCRGKTARNVLERDLKSFAVAQMKKIGTGLSLKQLTDKLERLTNLHAASDVARLDYEARRKEILRKMQPELEALESEYRPLLESAEENIATLEAEIKTEVLLHGQSVSGGAYRAVYTQGRISWDNEGMAKYANSHPEVLQFRKQGQPSVSLRSADDKH